MAKEDKRQSPPSIPVQLPAVMEYPAAPPAPVKAGLVELRTFLVQHPDCKQLPIEAANEMDAIKKYRAAIRIGHTVHETTVIDPAAPVEAPPE